MPKWKKTAEERFWEKVYKNGPILKHMDSPCWIWVGSRNGAGYGTFWDGNWYTMAHKFSYLIHYGKAKDGQIICHECDNPPCINPEHLFSGTLKDNTQDMIKKGRLNPPIGFRHRAYTKPETILMGEKSPASKLTDKEVIEIRERYKAGGISTRKIAKIYGVTGGTIQAIIKRKTWKHIL